MFFRNHYGKRPEADLKKAETFSGKKRNLLSFKVGGSSENSLKGQLSRLSISSLMSSLTVSKFMKIKEWCGATNGGLLPLLTGFLDILLW